MARTSRTPPPVEDATIHTDTAPDEPIGRAATDNLRTALDVCERCARWSRQVELAQSEWHAGVADAFAEAGEAVARAREPADLTAIADRFWRAAFDELRRRHGDLPYSLAALNSDIAHAWLGRMRLALEQPAGFGVTPLSAGGTPLHEQARESLDRWMQQWTSMWRLSPESA